MMYLDPSTKRTFVSQTRVSRLSGARHPHSGFCEATPPRSGFYGAPPPTPVNAVVFWNLLSMGGILFSDPCAG